MRRPWYRFVASSGRAHLAVFAISVLFVAGIPSASASDPDRPRAVLDGQEIPLGTVVDHHCHDRDLPTIRCFDDPADLAEDIGVAARDARGARLLGVAYVTFVEHEDYGGTAFVAYNPMADLGPYGWNDTISSFKSLNGQRSRFFSDANYGTPSWRWAAGAWVPNVGSAANDVISSLQNVP
jgi:hypothetical protein